MVQSDTVVLCAFCKEPLLADGTPCDCQSTGGGHPTRLGEVVNDEVEAVRSALAGDYEIREEIGRGGMAVVYRATERSLEREVAIKVLPLAMTFNAEFVERFQREARTAAGLAHPHIIPIYRVGQIGPVCFFAMKWVDGLSLAQLLQRAGRLPGAEIRRMLVEVGEALDFAHGRGVVHRDIKPDNIMRDETGRYVVADFGIAKSRRATALTEAGASIGTPRYMSPEQGTGRPVDGKSDLYSLGVVAYHCLAGEPPFDGDDPLAVLHGHVNTPVPEPRLTDPEDRALLPVVRALLEKDPARRPESGASVRDLLEGKAPSVRPQQRTAGAARVRNLVERIKSTPPGAWALGGTALLSALLFFGRDTAEKRCRVAVPGEDPAVAVLIDDLGPVKAGRSAGLEFLVCGLTEGTAFHAEMDVRDHKGGGVIGGVRRFFGGGGEASQSSWEDRADGFASVRSRPMSTGSLEPGDYEVTIKIEVDGGREAEVSQRFEILE